MASALGRAAMVGIKGIPATGASRRVAASGAARRGFKTNPHVEVNEENCLEFHEFCAMCTRRHRLQQWCFNVFLELYSYGWVQCISSHTHTQTSWCLGAEDLGRLA